MSSMTSIEWTDRTWNPVTGCEKVSQGCKNCYAETIANRFWKDRKFTDVHFHPERLNDPSGVSKSAVQFIHQGKHWKSEWPSDLRVREFPNV